MKVRTALDLLSATDDAEGHLRKLFEWQFERAMTLVRVGFGVAGSLLIALVAALSKHDDNVGTPQIVIIAAGIVLSAAFSVYRMWRVRQCDKDYVAALELLRLFRPLTPLLRLFYRQ
jgi:hypothetical protein